MDKTYASYRLFVNAIEMPKGIFYHIFTHVDVMVFMCIQYKIKMDKCEYK